jgi:hypothetical protein
MADFLGKRRGGLHTPFLINMQVLLKRSRVFGQLQMEAAPTCLKEPCIRTTSVKKGPKLSKRAML